jgi:serine/threonine protein kinase
MLSHTINLPTASTQTIFSFTQNILLIKQSNSNPNAKLSDEWQVKLCDFGSAYIGRMPLRSKQDRDEAADKIRTTTTQMYRAPEMVDLHMANELTES